MLLTSPRAQNIEGSGRRRRLLLGGVTFGLALAVLALMLATGTSRGMRLILFIPFWLTVLAVSQAATGT